MNDPGCVRGVEGGGNLLDDRHRALRRQRPVAAQQLAQVDALDVRHGDVQEAVVLPAGEDPHDVRIGDRGDDLHLAQEPLAEALVARELRREQLQRDGGPIRGAREIYRSGRALAERPLDPEAGDHCPGLDGEAHRRWRAYSR